MPRARAQPDVWSCSVRGKDGGSDGYDSIPRGHATAKNTLSVGAIGDLNQQAETAEKPEIESYSSWGPCDDGRI